MPKGVRIVASLPASKISSRKSHGHPLVTIALFSGLGLLVTFIAILCDVQGASFWFSSTKLPIDQSATAYDGGRRCHSFSCGAETGRGQQGARQGLLAVLGSDLDSIREDELGIGDADKTEYPAQIALEMLECRCWRAGAIKSATRDRQYHPLVSGEALGALRAISKCLAPHDDAVDPGLELAWDREIIHGRAKYDDVGGQKLVQHRLTGGEVLA